MKNSKGVGILEIVAALAIIALMITVALPILRSSVDAGAEAEFINRQARDLAQINEAIEGWASRHEAGMATAVTASLAIQDLIDEGLLPERFAQTDPQDASTVGTAPLGAKYSVFVRKDVLLGKETLRGIAIDEGVNDVASLLKAGINSKNAAGYKSRTAQWSKSVAAALLDNHKLVGGQNKSGTTSITGAKNSFEIDLVDFSIIPDSFRARAVVTYGFIGLDGGEYSPPGGPGGGAEFENSLCSMVMPVGSSDAFCPAGQTNIENIAICSGDLPTIIGVPEIAGTITWGYLLAEPLSFSGEISSDYYGFVIKNPVVNYSYIATYNDVKYFREFSMNKAFVGRVECASLNWHNSLAPSSTHPIGTKKPHTHYRQEVNVVADKIICGGNRSIYYRPKDSSTITSLNPNPKPKTFAYDGRCLINSNEIQEHLVDASGPTAAVCCLTN